MNRDEIMNMQAGREIDALVAEKVMGWRNCIPHIGTGFPPGVDNSIRNLTGFPKYSTDIAAAWRVAEKLRGDWSQSIGLAKYWQFASLRTGGWSVIIAEEDGGLQKNIIARLCDNSLPLAICRAALLAVAIE